MTNLKDMRLRERQYYIPFRRFCSDNDEKIRERANRDWKSTSPCPQTHIIALSKLGLQRSFGNHNEDKDLREYLDGRRVAVVGPSPYLIDTNHGKIIDDFDVVVRIHNYNGIENEEDYGSKSDIFVTCMNFNAMEQMIKYQENIDSHDFVIAGNIGMWNLDVREQWYLENFNSNFINLTDKYLFNLWDKVGTVTNTGFNIVCMLLEYDIKELHVAGFSFYMNSDYYHDDHIETSKTVRLDIHNQEKQKKYFRSILLKDNRVTLGPFLEKWRNNESCSDDTCESGIEENKKEKLKIPE